MSTVAMSALCHQQTFTSKTNKTRRAVLPRPPTKRGGVAVMALAGGAQALLLTFHSEATQYDDPLSRVDCRRDEAPRHGGGKGSCSFT